MAFVRTPKSGLTDLPLRPLLFATGAVVTAAGIYFYIKRSDGEKASNRMDTTAPKDPVCERARESDAVQPTDYLQDQMSTAVAEEKIQKLVMCNTQLEDRVRELEELLCEALRDCDARSEAEKKHQESVEAIIQLEEEKSDLSKQVETLNDSTQGMNTKLLESQREYDKLRHEYELERKAYITHQLKYNDMKKTLAQLTVENEEIKKTLRKTEEELQTECVQEQEAQIALQAENDELRKALIYTKELLKGCEQEREARSLLHLEHAEMKKIVAQLKTENDEMMKTLALKDELLLEHQKALEPIVELEEEKSKLTKQVETLKNSVQDMGNQLLESHRAYEQLRYEWEQKQMAYSVLQLQYNDVKETISQLEVRNDEMKKTRVHSEEELLKELEREREAHGILQAENAAKRKTSIHQQELAKECEQKQEAHGILQLECNELKKAIAQLQEENAEMKKTMTHKEAELKEHQKAPETLAQLEEEKSNLAKQVEKLRNSVQELGNNLHESHAEYEKLTCEYELEQDAHAMLQLKYSEKKKTVAQLAAENEQMKQAFMHKEEELLKKLEREQEARGVLQSECDETRATITQLKKENDVMEKTLMHTEEGLRKGREQEVRSVFRAESGATNRTLVHQEEFMQVSLAEAGDEHQTAVETMAQLEEKPNTKLLESHRDYDKLTYECEQEQKAFSILQSEYDEIKKAISQLEVEKDEMRRTLAHKEEEILKERERELETHSVLQTENDTMKKTLMDKEELLKVFIAEADEEHHKAMRTISQLEEEKCYLKEEVEKLNSTVQDMGNKLFKSRRDYDELTNECEREHEAYSNLTFEYNEMKKAVAQLEVENDGMKKTLAHKEEELLKERQREWEAHSSLQAEDAEIKKTLVHHEELLKTLIPPSSAPKRQHRHLEQEHEEQDWNESSLRE